MSLDWNIKSKEGRKEDSVTSYRKDDLCAKVAPPRDAPSPKERCS
jgi:hypothetical protein